MCICKKLPDAGAAVLLVLDHILRPTTLRESQRNQCSQPFLTVRTSPTGSCGWRAALGYRPPAPLQEENEPQQPQHKPASTRDVAALPCPTLPSLFSIWGSTLPQRETNEPVTEAGNGGQQPMPIPAGSPLWGGWVARGDFCLCVHACVQTQTEEYQLYTRRGMIRVVRG